MKIVIAPDSFKGTMAATEVCGIISRAIKRQAPDTEIVEIPVSDGGEGMADAYLAACGGEKRFADVRGPNGGSVRAGYAVLPNGTAAVEMAAASGLTLAAEPKDPMRASTYGTGQLIAHAIAGGCKKILLGLGGSATMDGGAGAAAALGVRLLDADGGEIEPTPAGLGALAAVDAEGIPAACREVTFRLAVDVRNPLTGKNGAAQIFGPQKGANPRQIELTDKTLGNLADILYKTTGKQLKNLPGIGAAGGFALPFMAFFDAEMARGVELLLNAADFDSRARGAGLVITGEGMFDSQSFAGKVPVGVARRAQALGIPTVVIAGDVRADAGEARAHGVCAVFSTNRRAVPFSQAKKTCREDLAALVESLFAFGGALPK